MKYNLDRGAHSVYSLHYHLVIVVKYRRRALHSEAIRERLKEIIMQLSENLGIEVLAQEPGEDHHHIFFKATPTTNLSNVVNVIKGTTARHLRQEFPETKAILWGDSFWSNSYFIATSGQVSLDVLKEYVESQGVA
ncbi:IS200/IS605 family transposase [Methanocella conradii]|uniref:IS200/IS605 family transposase n=1 Tax=Methanocella conradii TaxID=1175444 RepID=UPI0024B3AA55|nr:IS200/IS605 family transposase [Methanocella conradii]MDI6896182.1 IS200/IS605 family transposase [Methanocella conradii]